jgi:hypothetical protein
MGNALRLAALMFCALLVAASLRSDVSADVDAALDPVVSADEPTLEAPVEPAPGFETPQKDPFAPYDVGPAEEVVRYDELSPDDKAAADRGRSVAGWQGRHDVYAGAVTERSARAAAAAAQHKLGIDALDTTGVVP